MDALSRFHTRRTIERLRDGLIDSLSMNALTMQEEVIQTRFIAGLGALDNNQSEHLCICGSYGQGKSHKLSNLQQLALSQGYATSFVPLDIRETPFHQFSVVYHTLMKRLSLPDGKTFPLAWKQWAANKTLYPLLNQVPHRFQMILIAMLCKNNPNIKQTPSKKKTTPLPKDTMHWLEQALLGHDISSVLLKKIFKQYALEGYKKESMTCQGNLPYLQMVQALGCLLNEMGYKGLVIFFDEAESITQGRLGQRAKSYALLDELFKHKGMVYPIFAFTASFFDKVNQEDYNDEKHTFPQHYANNWKQLTLTHLHDFSSDSWDLLQNRLIQLYAKAYQIELSSHITTIKKALQALLKTIEQQETRFKIKALVNQLDIETQFLCLS